MSNDLSFVCGALVGFIIVGTLMTSAKRIPSPGKRRVVRFALVLAGLGAIMMGLVILARRDEHRILANYHAGCVQGCLHNSPMRSEQCRPFCDCQLAAMLKGRTQTQSIRWMSAHVSHGKPDAEFVSVTTANARLCASTLHIAPGR